MKKLLILVVMLALVLPLAACGGNSSDEDYGAPDDGYQEDGDASEQGDGGSDSGEFYDLYARGWELLSIFKELQFTYVDTLGGTVEYSSSLSYTYLGEETIDGQQARHYQCAYEQTHDGESVLEVWVNDNNQPIQALADGVTVTGEAVGPATLDFETLLEPIGQDELMSIYELFTQEDLEDMGWSVDKRTRETRDFGFGNVEVIHYELSQPDYDGDTEYEVWEYAKIGDKYMFTKFRETEDWGNNGGLHVIELTVERVIPH